MNTSLGNPERELVKACQNGDAKAQEQLYNAYSARMYAICLRYMGNVDDAKDALQEGFIKVFRNLSKYAFTGSFEGWLKRIFVNTSIEQLRKRKQHTDIEQAPEGLAQLDLHTIDSEKILDVVQKLPAGYRTVFNMYCVDGYSHKEIAEQLSISESTSKSQLFKARKLLQDWLKHWF